MKTKLGLALIFSLTIFTACGETRQTSSQGKMETLGKPEEVLQRPREVTGEFDIAKEPPRIDFGVLPGQWQEARLWSAWGDAVWAQDGNIYTSIGTHGAPQGHTYIYRVNPENGNIDQVVDVNKVLGLHDKEKYAPGKVHAPIVDADDGWIYFFTFRGSKKGSTRKKTGYRGDWLLRYHLATGQIENLGIPVADTSCISLEYHAPSHSLYGLAVCGMAMDKPKDEFFIYDIKEQKLIFKTESFSAGSRALIVLEDGRAYWGAQGKVLMRYNPKTQKTEKTSVTIPGNGTLRANTRQARNGMVYGFSSDGFGFSFDPEKEVMRSFGKAFPVGRVYITACRLDPTERYVYCVPGAHGRSYQQGSAVLRIDTKTGKTKVLAFLNPYLRQKLEYNLGGTYSLALSPKGDRFFIGWNGQKLGSKKIDFGLCSAMLLHLPETP